MSKGKIIFYDDDPDMISQFEKLMEESDFEIIKYTDLDVLVRDLDNDDLFKASKALVFDLARNNQEAGREKDFEILQHIEKKFHQYRIPIFIHSAFATSISNFENNGTVWKIEKSGTSLENISDIISKLSDSGFLEAFTPGGIIEQSLMQELHKSFCEQFRKGEIEGIINSIQKEDPILFKSRSIEVFKRTAVRSLLSEINSSLISNQGNINPIEHYYRRTSKIDFWTGDILKNKLSNEHVLIITPRCNVASKGYDQLLICEVEIGTFPSRTESSTQKEKINSALTDNPEMSGYNRFLPPSPVFAGGKVVLSKYKMTARTDLKNDYDVVISLSDELTNEILGKFGAYFFRSGITPWSKDEVIIQINHHRDGQK